jgi:hypothetical protein
VVRLALGARRREQAPLMARRVFERWDLACCTAEGGGPQPTSSQREGNWRSELGSQGGGGRQGEATLGCPGRAQGTDAGARARFTKRGWCGCSALRRLTQKTAGLRAGRHEVVSPLTAREAGRGARGEVRREPGGISGVPETALLCAAKVGVCQAVSRAVPRALMM